MMPAKRHFTVVDQKLFVQIKFYHLIVELICASFWPIIFSKFQIFTEDELIYIYIWVTV